MNSIGNLRYFLLFKDDYSSFVTLYFIDCKSVVEDFVPSDHNIKILKKIDGYLKKSQFLIAKMYDLGPDLLSEAANKRKALILKKF